MLVLGEREAATGTVAVREHGAGDRGVDRLDASRGCAASAPRALSAVAGCYGLALPLVSRPAPLYSRLRWKQPPPCRAVCTPLDART
jgi:hypothetical protein